MTTAAAKKKTSLFGDGAVAKNGVEELVGTIDRETCRTDSGFVILKTKAGQTVCGEDVEGELIQDQTYRFLGRWKNHARYGRQFGFDLFALDLPQYQRATAEFLGEHVPGFGLARAEKLWATYGRDGLTALRERPDEVAERCSILPADCHKAAATLRDLAGTAAAKVALYHLLAGRGFPRKLAEQAARHFGPGAAATIQRDPFQLLTARLPGCSFKKVDRLYLDLGHSPKRLKRQTLCAVASCWGALNGSTWVLRSKVEDAVSESIGHALAKPKRAVELAVRSQRLAKIDTRGLGGCEGEYLSPAPAAASERKIATVVSLRGAEPSKWPALADPMLSPHQLEEAGKALARPVGLLLGTPGTGKTTVAAVILQALANSAGVRNLHVAAPTGKAAVRITAAIRAAGITNVEATTVHRLLGYNGSGFTYNAACPLPGKFVIVDEASMLDADLCAALLAAVGTGGHVLFVGDPYQLPPVGHGAPLRDLQASGAVGVGLLTEVRRNGGLITAGCARIKDRQMPATCATVKLPLDNLRLVNTGTPTASLNALSAILERLRAKHAADGTEADPVWQCQVIVAANKKGELSRQPLNDQLQKLLNPEGQKATGIDFRQGDKIICLRNGEYPGVQLVGDELAGLDPQCYRPIRPTDGGPSTHYVANGEMGRVLAVGPGQAILQFDEPPRTVRIGVRPSGSDDDTSEEDRGRGCAFDLAYAVTCHKCVHPDTLVESAEGLLPIRLVASEGFIATPEGWRSYCNKVINPVGPAVEIECEDGYQVIVTPDHKVERWDDAAGCYSMCEAAELRLGQWMRVRLGFAVGPGKLSLLPPLPAGDVRAIRHKVPTACHSGVAEFLGLMVADGCVYETGFRLLKRHADVVERFGGLCRSLFGLEPRPVTGIGATGYEVSSVLLADWLRLVGGMSPNAKAIPECILRSPLKVQQAFLRGLFEDGTVNIRDGVCDHIELTTVYEPIARTVQTMLLRCGVISAVVDDLTIFRVYIYGAHAAQFREVVGFVSGFKNERLEKCIDTENRYRIPAGPVERELLWPHLGESDRGNIRTNGYVSRSVARKAPGMADRLQWHHVRVRSLKATRCPSMCVEVPDGHRFLQNGFPHGNSQGSQWRVVIVVIDDAAGPVACQEWHYTAISRAEHLCLLIGNPATLQKQIQRRTLAGRKTFLTELLADAAKEKV